MTRENITIQGLFCLILACLGGCAAPLTMQGLSSGVPVAFNSAGRGEGDSAWLARYDDVVQAIQNAGQKLSLNLREMTIGAEQSAFNYIDDRGSKLEILVERRTETVTWVGFNVGWFESKSIGRLMANQVGFELDEEGKFLGDWHMTEGD
jgi:hypothetical protein